MAADSSHLVKPRDVHLPGTRPAIKTLPELELKPSSIPDAGIGVFARTAVRRGAYVTEYDGELIDWSTATERRGAGGDTHIIGIGQFTDAIDSRVTERFPLNYYTERHGVGGLINDPHNTGKAANVAYHWYGQGKQYPSPSGTFYSTGRVFLKALCDIAAGEELLVNYDSTYHGLHFND
jgi:hypothetical protein